MASIKIRAAFAALTVSILLISHHTTLAEITCTQVNSYIASCLSFARTGRGSPSERCCRGVSDLYDYAKKNATDLEKTCNCLKEIAGQNNINATATASIPEKCNVKVPFVISTSTDCSRLSAALPPVQIAIGWAN